MSAYAGQLNMLELWFVAVPRVEETLVLSLSSASLWRKHALPSKPCRATSAFVGKAYVAAG